MRRLRIRQASCSMQDDQHHNFQCSIGVNWPHTAARKGARGEMRLRITRDQ
jgi:hypothetical protein